MAVAAAGAHVVLAARDRRALDGVAGQIKDAGGQATPLAAGCVVVCEKKKKLFFFFGT